MRTERREVYVEEADIRSARSSVDYRHKQFGYRVVKARRVDPMRQGAYIVTIERRSHD